MPRGDKSSYTDKKKRHTEHIEQGYEERGVSEKEATRRAWATVKSQDHGGKKSGSGVGKPRDTSCSRKGGCLGGRAAARHPTAERSRSARKATASRRSRGASLNLPAPSVAVRCTRCAKMASEGPTTNIPSPHKVVITDFKTDWTAIA